jgi:hypothetical protein
MLKVQEPFWHAPRTQRCSMAVDRTPPAPEKRMGRALAEGRKTLEGILCVLHSGAFWCVTGDS